MKAQSLSVQKLMPRLSLLWTDGRTDGRTDRQTDRQGDSYIPPQTSFAGGITMPNYKTFSRYIYTNKSSFLPCNMSYRFIHDKTTYIWSYWKKFAMKYNVSVESFHVHHAHFLLPLFFWNRNSGIRVVLPERTSMSEQTKERF